ncbi:MAG: hypothetical protein KDH88_11330 [Chromatiales bacterium]|nr:hypothetical protein [Chromatiales bacterium]
MQIGSATGNALHGIQQGMEGLRRNALRVAGAGQEGEAPNHSERVEALVEMKGDQQQVQASAKALKTANETLGSLLDVQA